MVCIPSHPQQLGCVESNQGNKTNKKRTLRINELRNLLRPQPILLNSVPIFILRAQQATTAVTGLPKRRVAGSTSRRWSFLREK